MCINEVSVTCLTKSAKLQGSCDGNRDYLLKLMDHDGGTSMTT